MCKRDGDVLASARLCLRRSIARSPFACWTSCRSARSERVLTGSGAAGAEAPRQTFSPNLQPLQQTIARWGPADTGTRSGCFKGCRWKGLGMRVSGQGVAGWVCGGRPGQMRPTCPDCGAIRPKTLTVRSHRCAEGCVLGGDVPAAKLGFQRDSFGPGTSRRAPNEWSVAWLGRKIACCDGQRVQRSVGDEVRAAPEPREWRC